MILSRVLIVKITGCFRIKSSGQISHDRCYAAGKAISPTKPYPLDQCASSLPEWENTDSQGPCYISQLPWYRAADDVPVIRPRVSRIPMVPRTISMRLRDCSSYPPIYHVTCGKAYNTSPLRDAFCKGVLPSFIHVEASTLHKNVNYVVTMCAISQLDQRFQR